MLLAEFVTALAPVRSPGSEYTGLSGKGLPLVPDEMCRSKLMTDELNLRGNDRSRVLVLYFKKLALSVMAAHELTLKGPML